MGAAPEDGGLSPREGKGAALVAGAAPVGSPVKGLTYFFGYVYLEGSLGLFNLAAYFLCLFGGIVGNNFEYFFKRPF